MHPKAIQTREGYYSSREAAEQLGLTIDGVRKMRDKGVIAGTYDKSKKRWWYSHAEVAATARYRRGSKPLRRGEETARAFDLFAEGIDVRGVVRKLRITTARAVILWKEYDPGVLVHSSQDFARLRKRLDERGLRARSVPELYDALDRLCNRDEQLQLRELSDLATG